MSSSSRALERSVRELLEDLDLFRLPIVPKEVCARLGVEYREYPYDGTEGTLLVVGNQQLIGVNSKTRETSRKAFTCAHELGHYYFDLDEKSPCAACSSSDVEDVPGIHPRELRANAFAAELLMPRVLFEPLIASQKPSWALTKTLAERCGSSLQATAQRYVELSPYRCWLAVLRDGRIYRYQKHPRSKAHLNTRQVIQMPVNASAEWQVVPAEFWMGVGRHTRDRRLYQSFLPKNQYGETLVLLWDRHHEFEKFNHLASAVGRSIRFIINQARRAAR